VSPTGSAASGRAGTENPTVSIIVPVYNNAAVTRLCIDSIFENTRDVDFEVIVVDDGSEPDSATRLRELDGVRVVRNPTNVGFIKACHRGADEAAGEYLVFLNNDTLVHAGWLAALMEAFQYAPPVGLVGAKLLYPDGRLQEAGGIIWRDGTAWNYGRGDDPNRPKYCYVRDVDYCSGACIVVPRELFFEIGRFDERYCPAYYEDVDLAFKMRAAGQRVLYAPHSRVTHHEGWTSGTDERAGVKSYQLVNQAKFRAKWSEPLEHHGAPGILPDLEKDRGSLRRVLVIDHYVLMPDQAAGDLRMFNLMRILRGLGCTVTFIGSNLAYSKKYVPPLERAGIEVLYHPHIQSVESHLKENGKFYDVVLVSRPTVARDHLAAVRRYCPRAQVIYDTVDLHHLREARQAGLQSDANLAHAAMEHRNEELSFVELADVTFVVSEAERSVLRSEKADAVVEIVPTLYEIHGCSIPFDLRRDLLFIGGFDHPPNADAMLFFTESVFPIVRERLEGVRLYIVGSNPRPEVRKLAARDVVVTGYVPDVSPFFKCARVFVAPLRFGAGISGKIHHSLSYGLPVVSTSLAAEGLGLEDGVSALIANSPEEFADAVVRLYETQKTWEELSANGLRHVQDHFSFETVRENLARILELQCPIRRATTALVSVTGT
jgi:GT2 family glycosyltransferase/glycosyltransferase involved in cell wall biosynthesis